MTFVDELFSDVPFEEIFGSDARKLSEDLSLQMVSDVPGQDRGQVETHSDEQTTQHLHNLNFGKKGGIAFGRIVYCQPYTHWYRVQIDDMDGDMICCRLTDASTTPGSVRDTAPLAPNTSVLLWRPDEGHFGFILNAVPDKVEDGNLVYPDWVSQGANVGFKREAYYHELFDLTADDADGMDFSNSRPLDSLSSGEWGRMSDFGGGIHIDNFMAFIRADESCGAWFFYLDRLARLSGHNLDIRTAVSEQMVRDDSEEGLNALGTTPYAWEAMGAFTSGQAQLRDETDFDVHYTVPYGRLEPKTNDQYPFYRYEEFRGYLGQAYMRHLAVPDLNSGLRRLDNSQIILPGVFREQIGLDGSYGLTSAHSISITKRSLIAIPKRKKLPAAPDGDDLDAGNYKFAGLFGEGEDHIVGSPTATDENSHVQETMALSDFLAHLFEWKSIHPFHYHKTDFDTPEQTEASQKLQSLQSPPQFSRLSGGDPWLPPPRQAQQRVDHRYESVDYFETTAGFYLLPEGGAVFRGGGGEEIRMVGGRIQISAPGDVWLQPGRNVVLHAGDDLIAKAKNSMEFTATDHDVRFKAERNLEFLAANSGAGRMLFENKAIGTFHDVSDAVGEDLSGSGFLFKAKNSQFITAVQEVYLRTGVEGGIAGPITLDAGKGQADINAVCRSYIRHIESLATDTFPVAGNKRVANNYTAFNAQIHSSLQIDGGLVVTENGMLIKGNIAILGGHIGTELAEEFNGLCGVIKGENAVKAKESLEEVEAGIAEFKEAMSEFYEGSIEDRFYAEENFIGNDKFQEASSFSLRTAEQMNTKEFLFAEAYWQQIAQLTGTVPNTWTEKVITYRGLDMMPYPGIDKWTSASWLTAELKLHDSTSGTDAARGSIYEEFENYEALQKVVPDGKFPIVSL